MSRSFGTAADGDGRERADVAAIAQAIGLSIIAVIPGFLPGALAVSLRAEFGFGPSTLGLLIAWFFISTAVLATLLGKLVERLGIPVSLMLGSLLSAAGLGIGAAAPSTHWLLVAMTAGGAANAISQPAVNASLSRRIPAGNLGLAIGIKQSAIPAATLLAGLAVPTVAALLGWRATFATAGIMAFAGALMARRMSDDVGSGNGRRRIRTRDLPELRSLVILSLAGVLGASASTSLGAFFVDAAVEGGIAEGSAGLFFAGASMLGVTSRVLLGWHADRRPHGSPYGRIAALLAAGAPGYLLLATGVAMPYVIGGLIAYGAGWAWTGLFHFAAVSQNPTTPAAATGVIQAGNSLGAGAGPLVLGWVAETWSYQAAWLAAAALSAAAAIMFLVGRAHLRRTRRTVSASYLAEITPLTFDGAEHLAPGVEARAHRTEHLDVTMYRVAPGAVYEVAPAPRSGVVVVLGGKEFHLRVEAIDSVARQGEHLPLPANRTWRLHNDSAGYLIVAHAAAHGRTDTLGTTS